MTYALITAIEPNKQDINTLKQNYTREYETEAIKCFNDWRLNAGWLKDIPIYCLCPTKNDISEKTKNIFKSLNVNYIHNYIKETDEYENGYWNIPLMGKYFEEKLDENILIKIDLDMYLLKEIPKNIINSSKTIVGRYDINSAKHNLNSLFFPENLYGLPFDTGLIISHKAEKFYEKYYNTLKLVTHQYNTSIKNNSQDIFNIYNIKVQGEFEDGMDYGVLEEFSVNLLNLNTNNSIQGIEKYNIGEYYIPLSEYNDDEIKNIYFLHEHKPVTEPGYNGLKLLIEYKKRLSKTQK